MKSVFYESTGPSSVLRDGDLPKPAPGPGEVLVEIACSSINPSDTKSRSGWGDPDMPASRIVPHNDGSGTIVDVGQGVNRSRTGSRVWVYEATLDGRHRGTAATHCVVPSSHAVGLPDSAGFDTGACLGVPAMTAHYALFGDGSVTGATVLVTGGAGGVGHMAVQLARWAGARVIATVGGDSDADLVRDLGAHAALDYHSDDLAERILHANGGDPVDRIVEVNFGANLAVSLDVVRRYGTVATYASGNDPEAEVALPFYKALGAAVRIAPFIVYTMPRSAHEAAAHDINRALEAGALRAVIGERYGFSAADIARAHDDLDAGKVLIKPVIDIL